MEENGDAFTYIFHDPRIFAGREDNIVPLVQSSMKMPMLGGNGNPKPSIVEFAGFRHSQPT
jgi:hypothetical protein